LFACLSIYENAETCPPDSSDEEPHVWKKRKADPVEQISDINPGLVEEDLNIPDILAPQ